jgi:hypothetical protein
MPSGTKPTGPRTVTLAGVVTSKLKSEPAALTP